jgi:exodeoxyribonuclease-5
MYTLNEEQTAALTAIKLWLSPDNTEQFMVLKGSAGTGKTFCIRQLAESYRGRLAFTAPTNKATKVLRESVTTKDYKPECRTIYSMLGLRLEANGEVRELTGPSVEDPIDLTAYKCIVVDEGSMVNENLRLHINNAADTFGIKFLFLGDRKQLPPVGERESPIWRIKNVVELTKVMRHDNQILTLATRLGSMVDHPAPRPALTNDFNEDGGVRATSPAEFATMITTAADEGEFSDGSSAKVIAWRNVTVDRYNRLIRSRIFPDATQPWLVGDRVLFTAPGKDLDDRPMVSTDDEGLATRVEASWHPMYGEFKTWRINITLDDNRTAVAHVLHEDSFRSHAERVSQLSAEARANGRKWKDFWAFKEAFHSIRYAYAITSHRSQGSTFLKTFVDYRDILVNQTRHEAMRCLYVAASRPKVWLILG